MIKNVQILQGYTEIVSASEKSLANLGIYFCNSSKHADVIDVFVMSSDQTPGDETKVISQLYIPASETFMFGNEKFILDTGESIGASAEVGGRIAATVTFTDL
tara:strand:- start:10605 stop:10913 length:309 start_codon:yes stop_codon:yes gene_type:complete